MASRVASQLCRAAAIAEEFSRLARSASSSDMANAGDEVIPMHPMRTAALTVRWIFSTNILFLPIQDQLHGIGWSVAVAFENMCRLGDSMCGRIVPIYHFSPVQSLSKEINFEEEFNKIINDKINEQLMQFSNMYFNKIQKNLTINEI